MSPVCVVLEHYTEGAAVPLNGRHLPLLPRMSHITYKMQKPSKANSLQGFKVISVQFSAESSAQHEMFAKEHSVKNHLNDKPVGRTMFIVNVPPWATEEGLSEAFGSTVESVAFTKIVKDEPLSRSGFKAAYVVFKGERQLHRALAVGHLPPLSTIERPIRTGLCKWVAEYNERLTSQKQLEARALSTIKAYDAEEEARKHNKGGETDDDGWTLVTKNSRNPGVPRKESVLGKLTRKQKVLKNFYRHQIRQEKRDRLAELRRKAEEDRKKIAALRQRRAFKPF